MSGWDARQMQCWDDEMHNHPMLRERPSYCSRCRGAHYTWECAPVGHPHRGAFLRMDGTWAPAIGPRRED